VSAPKENKNVPASESGVRKQKQKKAKLIRLDDLIAKSDVRGGGQLLFGATDTTINNPTQKG
jgi:hypothetical protein